MNNTTFGDDSFAYYETVAGGAGAVSDFFCLQEVIHSIYVIHLSLKLVD